MALHGILLAVAVVVPLIPGCRPKELAIPLDFTVVLEENLVEPNVPDEPSPAPDPKPQPEPPKPTPLLVTPPFLEEMSISSKSKLQPIDPIIKKRIVNVKKINFLFDFI